MMRTTKSHRSRPVRDKSLEVRAFTLVEMLVVISIMGILAGLLLPALENAHEQGKRVACMNNLRQIGSAILAYAGDYDNHTPPAWVNIPNGPWYATLTNGYVNSTKIFKCPDDRRRANPGVSTPRSYAIVIGKDNNDPPVDWIAGSRLTCPYLTNSAVAIVGELYSLTNLPIFEASTYVIIKSPLDTTTSYMVKPNSMHDQNHPMSGNFLFVDGHVEWVQNPENRLEMFPPPPFPTTPACP